MTHTKQTVYLPLVSFELAKLLKEKGFDKRSEPNRYNNQGNLTMLEGINAPTIAEVVMWFYEKHGIWIYVHPDIDYRHSLVDFSKWAYSLENRFVIPPIGYDLHKYNSPTEAYEAALTHLLNKFI